MPEWLTIKASVKLTPPTEAEVPVEVRKALAAGVEADKPVRAKAPPKQREQRPPLDPKNPYSQGYERVVMGRDADGNRIIVGWEKITDEEGAL